jgi:hypothetical protein
VNKSIKEIKYELECTHKQLIENYKKELIEHRKNRLLKQILEIEKELKQFKNI